MPLPPEAASDAIALLTALIRVDTSNPPGNERACAEVLAQFLRRDGYDPVVLESAPERANLVVRRKGSGTGGGPLLLTGHMDVVPADAASWKHPPFGAVVEDGWLYGRGAVDMKNHLAACATVMRQLAREGTPLGRDVIFAAVADEEAGCEKGARFLVDEHPELVRAEYALGELGGFTLPLGGKRLYPIQVAHRGAAWMTLRTRGPAGHGSMPRPDSAVLALARAVMRIGNLGLPAHVTEPTRRMLEAMGSARGGAARLAMRLLARPALTDFVLDSFISDAAVRRSLSAILHNTATPTVLQAGAATNVIPPVAEARVDGRLLPGQTGADLLRELREVIDDDGVELEIFHELAPVAAPIDSPLYRQLEAAVREMDPEGVPIPYVMPGFTDGSAFQRLGTHFYGFAPIWFPESPRVSFSELYHGHDERLPIAGFVKGLEALWRAVTAFAGARGSPQSL